MGAVWSKVARFCGGNNVTPFFKFYAAYSNRGPLLVDSLAGVARRWKDINGAQRLTQPGQKSGVECKSKSQPNWDPNKMDLSNES